MDSAMFAILIIVKLVEAEPQPHPWPAHLAMEARLLTFSLKALELRTDPVLIVAQRASLTTVVSAEIANSDHHRHAHSHLPLFQLLTSHSHLF